MPEGVGGAHMDPPFFDCCTSHHLRLFPCFTFFLEIVQVAIFAIFVCDIFVFAISVTQPPPISPNFTKPTPANERPGFAGARARHTYRKTVG